MVIVEGKMGDEAVVSVCTNDSLSKHPKPGREGGGDDDNYDAADDDDNDDDNDESSLMTTMKKSTGNGDGDLWRFNGVSFQKRIPIFFCHYMTQLNGSFSHHCSD